MEQDSELTELYNRFKDDDGMVCIDNNYLVDGCGLDIVGCVEAALPTDQCRTRRIVSDHVTAVC